MKNEKVKHFIKKYMLGSCLCPYCLNRIKRTPTSAIAKSTTKATKILVIKFHTFLNTAVI